MANELVETDIPPATYADILNRHPRTHTKADRTVLITTLRAARAKYATGNKTAGAQKQLTGEKAVIAKIDLGDIKL